MPYATVSDVEARLGDVFNEDVSRRIGLYLSDFSIYLDTVLPMFGITVSLVNPEVLKMIVAQRGATYYFTMDLDPTVSARSEGTADTNESTTYRGPARKFSLDTDEKDMLGLNKRKISTIEIVRGDYNGRQPTI
jgi:hypothetical protein